MNAIRQLLQILLYYMQDELPKYNEMCEFILNYLIWTPFTDSLYSSELNLS